MEIQRKVKEKGQEFRIKEVRAKQLRRGLPPRQRFPKPFQTLDLDQQSSAAVGAIEAILPQSRLHNSSSSSSGKMKSS